MVETLMTWDDFRREMNSAAQQERTRRAIAAMKGRKRRALLRANRRWDADPVHRCARCSAVNTMGRDIVKLCKFGHCHVELCSSCKSCILGSWGPVGCPCDTGRGGHGTYAEMRQPSGKRKFRDLHRRIVSEWEQS